MLNTSVFAAFGGGVTPVTPDLVAGVTQSECSKTQHNQQLNKANTPVTSVTSQNNNGWDEEDWQCAFDERAAILEYDAGMTRPAAEAMARREITEQRSRT